MSYCRIVCEKIHPIFQFRFCHFSLMQFKENIKIIKEYFKCLKLKVSGLRKLYIFLRRLKNIIKYPEIFEIK